MNKIIRLVIVMTILACCSFAYSAEKSPLAEKLVAGSPWEFTTQYENTDMQFRYNAAGELERWAPSKNEWRTVTLKEGDKIVIKTKMGHTITLFLNEEGKATSEHSKHSSKFRSLK